MKRIILCIAIAAISSVLYSQEDTIGESYYDLQTNGSCQNRIYVFDDGTIGATWTQSHEQYSSYPDRGTGYNYFNGSAWQPWPEERIESMRTGWPSYAPLGENGELVVSHLSGADTIGLLFCNRTTKGQGNWTETLFTGPMSHEQLMWPRMVTGGANHSIIYLLALTAPVYYGGSVYQGLNGALLYSRSTDGGNTWGILNQILPGMDSTEYHGFPADCYAFAEPKDNVVAFVVGSYSTDMFLMKSTNNGSTFEKTIIWDNPYNAIPPAETFYCVDGSMSVALDAGGKAHVVFGLVSAYYDDEWEFNRDVDGVGYWNEDRSAFSSNINALNPAGGAGSEMVPDYNLVGWSQDINGNGQLEIIGIGIYGSMGMSSMVQLVIDESDRMFLCYAPLTESYNDGSLNYRRLWFRSSPDGGNNWGQFYHYAANDTTHIFTDFFFPSCASGSDNFIYCIFHTGMEPCLNGYGSETNDNSQVTLAKIHKGQIVGIAPGHNEAKFEVAQNFPNPFNEETTINVNLNEPSLLILEIKNLMGQTVSEPKVYQGLKGSNTLNIQCKNLSPGTYFYTVISSGNTVTRKMMIEN